MNTPPNFVNRLNEWLDSEDLTHEEAAARVGVSRTYFSQIIGGRRPGPKFIGAVEAEIRKNEHSAHRPGRTLYESEHSVTVREEPPARARHGLGIRGEFRGLLREKPDAWLVERARAIALSLHRPDSDYVEDLCSEITRRLAAKHQAPNGKEPRT